METSKWAVPNFISISTKPSPTAQPFIPSHQTSIPLPTPENDHMDEFAQTRDPDDLFADDFTPITMPVSPRKPQQSRGQQHTTRTTRGRGPRRGTNIRSEPPAPPTEPTMSTIAISTPSTNTDSVVTNTVIVSAATPVGTTEMSDGNTPTPAPTSKTPSTPAVRGDRTATGGLAKPKLSETELAERMESIKLKNASLTAAHERAEADEASFQAREIQAQERRKLERQNRQQMMGEREKNRARKLQAVGGREWDAEKGDLMQDNGRGSGLRRGAFGGVAVTRSDVEAATTDDNGDLAIEYEESSATRRGEFGYRGRGGVRGVARGGRGGRGGRSRGGGGGGAYDNDPSGQPRGQPPRKPPQTVPGEMDFPALPPISAASKTEKSQKGPSWAEEMEDAKVDKVDL